MIKVNNIVFISVIFDNLLGEPTLSPIEYTTDDINAVLEPVDTPSSTSEPITTPPNMSKRSTSLLPELDELELVLQGFGTPVDEEDQTKYRIYIYYYLIIIII